MLKPQLPPTMVVTPWNDDGEQRAVPEDLRVVVRVHVDEARADDAARRVDRRRAPRSLTSPMRGDAAAADRDVGAAPGRAGPIHHGTPANHDVEHDGLPAPVCDGPIILPDLRSAAPRCARLRRLRRAGLPLENFLNHFAHARVAASHAADPLFALGAMLPDFASMLRERLGVLGHPALRAGALLHTASDAVFHAAPEFVAQLTAGSAALRDAGRRARTGARGRARRHRALHRRGARA